MVAELLAHSIAFNEGLYGPNDLGYVPDLSVSLYRKEEMVFENVTTSATVFAEHPNLFGPKTKPIYEGITKRLDTNRSMFLGRRVINKEFPPFPQSKQISTPQTS